MKLHRSLLVVGALCALLTGASAQVIGPPAMVQLGGDYPIAAVPVSAASGTVAAATASATLAANASKTNYLCGFAITSTGSTAAAVVAPTVTGTISTNWTLAYATVAGATLSNQPLVVALPRCVPATGQNVAIVVSLPSLGAGNTNATVVAWGYQL